MIRNMRTLIVAGRARVAATLILAVVAGWACWHSVTTVRAVPPTIWNVSVGSLGACTPGDPTCATIGAAVAAALAGDTINVAAGTYNEWDIVIDKDLTINGAGANTTIVDANQVGRVFYTCCGTVNISGLTIKNGLTAPVITPPLTSKNRITPNVNGLAYDGGGIYNSSGGTLNLSNCTVSDNATAAGGGVFLTTGKAPKSNQRFAHVVRAGLTSQAMGGAQGGNGGGIFNGGMLTLMNCTVTNNRTGFGADSDTTGGNGGDGGGIYNLGTLIVTNSTIADNRTGRGGYIFSIPGATRGDTTTDLIGPIPGNGGEGGGISNDAGGTLDLRNSTIAGNETGPAGGFSEMIFGAAKRANGTATTGPLVGASGGNGGGIYSGDTMTTTSAISTIIANNRAAEGGLGPDLFTDNAVLSYGYNLVGIADGSTGFTQPTDQTGTGMAPLDPMLGPLANNGGPTQTMALLANSPAIDMGINSGCADSAAKNTKSALACGLPFDQRGTGFPRTFDLPVANAGDGTDVGAFEVQTAFPCAPDVTPPVITCPGSVTKFTDSGQFNAIVNTGTPVATDNCALQSITGVRNDGKPLNNPYPVGVTLITWTATDASGNKASCGQSIAVMIPSGLRKRIG